MASLSDLQVQVTLTLKELGLVVGLLELARENLPEAERPELIDEISGMYFQMMEQLDENLGDFTPE